jgi:hypothetical protein
VRPVSLTAVAACTLLAAPMAWGEQWDRGLTLTTVGSLNVKGEVVEFTVAEPVDNSAHCSDPKGYAIRDSATVRDSLALLMSALMTQMPVDLYVTGACDASGMPAVVGVVLHAPGFTVTVATPAEGRSLFAGEFDMSHAAHTLQEFQDARTAGGAKWRAFQLYIDGVGDGFEMALRRPLPNESTTTSINGMVTTTVAASTNGASRPQPPYCPNAKQPLNLDTYLLAINKEIEVSKPTGNQWIEEVLMSGLMKVFPCEGKRPFP